MYNLVIGTAVVASTPVETENGNGKGWFVYANAFVKLFSGEEDIRSKMLIGLKLSEKAYEYTLKPGDHISFTGRLVGDARGGAPVVTKGEKSWSYYSVYGYNYSILGKVEKDSDHMDNVTYILLGNVGKAPEMRFTPKGHPVTNMTVAANRTTNFGKADEQRETVWHNVAVWGKGAESANEKIQKGALILVQGEFNADIKTGGPRMWEAKDGTLRATYELTSQTYRTISRSSSNVTGTPPSFGGEEDTEIPF